MNDMLIFIALIFIAYGIGRLVLNFFVNSREDLLEDFIFSLGLGLALLGYIVYAIGNLGLLYPKYIFTILFICGLIAFYPVYKFLRCINIHRFLKTASGMNKTEKCLAGILLFIPIMCLFGAIAPAIGNDSLAYHLHHPRLFIQNHRIGFIPLTRESLWPYLGQMLFTIGLLFKSVTIAKLFHYFFGILCILGIFSFTRRFFSKKEALLATSLFALSPGIFTQMTYAYVDLAQCLYSFLALYSIFIWIEKENRAFLILSGIFIGIGLSVKLMSGITLIALLPIIVFYAINKKAPYRKVIRDLFIFSLFAFIAGCAWYIRSYIVLGNPVYPFLHSIFGSGWETNISTYVGTRKDFIGFLMLPWDIVMHADSFGGEQIGIIFLVLFPCLFFLPVRVKNIQYLLSFFTAYAIIWFIVDPMFRFGFVNFAVAFILISIGLYRILARYKIFLLKMLLAGCIIFNVLLCVYHNRDAVMLAFGQITRHEYLVKKERSYPVAEFVNNGTPLNSLIIMVGEPRGFYFNRDKVYYSRWKQQVGKDILLHINDLKLRSRPVYLVYRDDADYQDFKPLIVDKEALFSLSREVDRGKKAIYYIYEL
jgi:hypothetical protein